MATQLFTTTNAATTQFVKVKMRNVPFSLSCDTGAVVGGTPTYSLKVCNFDGDESDFRAIDDATLLPLTDVVVSSNFNHEYLGLSYTANSATGTIQFYLNLAE